MIPAVRALRADLKRLEQRLRRDAAKPATARATRVCKVPGCNQPHTAHGYCKNHYQQARYRDRQVAQAKAKGKTYRPRRPGERRPGRKPKIPLTA